MADNHTAITPDSYQLSAAPAPLTRPPKRSHSASCELPFFKPAEESFNPLPYAPAHTHPKQAPRPAPVRAPLAPGMAYAPPPMDPTPDDPNALFIHPPFTDFPNAHLYGPEGLTYSVLAANPEWFLDPDDFKSATNDSEDALAYPAKLEPPRGWCPAKKKDLKERGVDNWPEGQEPRLRCTFCRRTYAGVNAKSMWRRHVYEKHKIAMSNRRDGQERVRGRNSNKENRLVSRDTRRPQKLEAAMAMQPPRVPHVIGHYRVRNAEQMPPPAAPLMVPGEFPNMMSYVDGQCVEHAHPLSQSTVASNTPPLTPQELESPQAFSLSLPSLSEAQVTSTPVAGTSTTPLRVTVPASPYNPMLTPAFRHSPPRLPSDQPWRFPSPSHPLHLQSARDLSLGVILGCKSSPFTPGPMRSPAVVSSVRGTPIATSPLSRSRSLTGQVRMPSGSTRARATPRRLFSTGSLPAGLNAHGRTIYRPNGSPADGSADSSLLSDTTDSSVWTSDGGSLLELEPPIRLVEEDPFAGSDHHWLRLAETSPAFDRSKMMAKRSPPSSCSEIESPIARTTALVAEESPIIRSARTQLGVGALSKRPTLSLRLSDIRTSSRTGLGIAGVDFGTDSSLMSPFALSNDSEEDDADSEECVGGLLYPDSDDEDAMDTRARKRRKSN
ncbi:hypothetical protein PUNSTDRAFT_140541 [Punctularia strigosozonata HHB-11173 SS5]|uniref:uncharacterized protein n=1 Tax=Punctularia strigosozonata (strain HHB-11173) TaxID=741275 RepID=UPI0004417F55|nr:uncharacterized protein PUNSTDRAFT_140541 [Punctularia strigosozonata HHB-11173 SS5]EIN14195.1 hypothetical protein PUNSTDRAFT_140541 [Punctularia strigosozonata HHB-11173 SS5]